MIRLIKNEFVKEYTTKRIIITLIIFVLISFITYGCYIYIPKIAGQDYINTQDNYYQMQENYNKTVANYKQTNSANDLLLSKLYEKELERAEIMYKYQISTSDWRYDALSRDFDTMSLIILELLVSGKQLPESYTDYHNYQVLSKEEQNSIYESLLDSQNNIISIVKTGYYYDYAKIALETVKEQINNTSDDFYLSELKNDVLIYEYVISKSIKEKDDYRLRELIALNELKDTNDYKILSETDFYENINLSQKYYNYQEYLESATNRKTFLNNEIRASSYAVDHEIKYNSNDYKNITSYIFYFFFIIGIVVAIRSSNTIYGEREDGSIRLLLVQGVERYKIVLAKYINIILDIFIHYIVFAIIFIVVGLLFYEFKDLLTPNIMVLKDTLVFSNFFIDLFRLMLMSIIPLIFISTFSLLASVTTINSVVTVSLNIILLLSSFKLLDWIKIYHLGDFWRYTPIPYINMTKFMYLGEASTIGIYDFITSVFNINGAITVLFIWTIAFIMIAMYIFEKKDIENK